MMTLSQIQVKPDQGLNKTLQLMNELEKIALSNQTFQKFVYENFYSECTACIPGKIWNYMKNNFIFKSDDPFDELLTAPYLLIETKTGDCDDFSLFAKTCLDMLGGWFTNYILFAKEKNSFSHVACFAHRGVINNNYIDGVVIDGANENFNIIPMNYKFYKIIK